MESERSPSRPPSSTSRARRFSAPLVLVTLLLSGSAVAEPPGELVTDRPDQTESASVVPRGWMQLEVGAVFVHDSAEGLDVETLEAPGSLLRIGVHDRVELRVGWTGFVHEEVRGPAASATVDGGGDMELGAKFLLRDGSGRRPQVALLVTSTVPVGEDEVTSDAYNPSFRFNFDYDLGESLGLGINLGAEWLKIDGDSGGGDSGGGDPGGGDPGGNATAARFVYTAALGHALSETHGVFVEIFGSESIDGPDAGSEASLDGGFTWLLRPNLQLDLAAGVGLTDSAEDWFVGAGVSVRWPD